MAVPVDKVGGVQGGQEGMRVETRMRGKTRSRKAGGEDEQVTISREARDRASGKKRGNILEYLENGGD